MSKEKFNENLKNFYKGMDERLESLSPPKQQEYLEGIVYAFGAMTKFGNLVDLSPIEQQDFIANIKSWVYSKTTHLGLDDKNMEKLLKADTEYVVQAYNMALKLQEAMGVPLSLKEKMQLRNGNILFVNFL